MSGGDIDTSRAWILVEAWIGSARLDRAADYLRRGRRFADRKTYELKFDWRDRRERLDAGTLADLEAELALRGEGTPRPRCSHGIGRHWHEELRDRMTADPATWGTTERHAYEAALAFQREWREAVKH
jgi:hypothetical protein